MDPVDKKKTVKYFFFDTAPACRNERVNGNIHYYLPEGIEKLLMIDMIDYLVQLIYIFFCIDIYNMLRNT